MKNFLRIAILVITIFTLFSACKKNRTVHFPILGFDDEAGYVFSNTTIAKNSTPRIKLVVQKGDALLSTFYFLINDSVTSFTEAKITGFVASEILPTNTEVNLVSEDQTSFTLVIFPKTNLAEGVYKWSFVIVDDKGLATQRDLTFTVDETNYSDSLTVSLSDTLGTSSFVKSTTGQVLNESGFQVNKGLVDLTFAMIDLKPSVISSYLREQNGFVNGIGGIKSFYAISTLDFNTVTEVEIENIKKPTSQILTLEENQTYEFVSEVNSRGLFRVKKIEGESVLISVKAIKID